MTKPETTDDEHAPVLLPGPLLEPDPLHPDEVAERSRLLMERNDARTRAKLVLANRKRDIPEPKVGDKLYVTTIRGIARRSRGGLRFEHTTKREVEVVDLSPDELAARQLAGASVVSVHGAEEILADESLQVHAPGASMHDLRAAHDRALADNARLRAELAAARRDAPPDAGDGSSSRLKAAAKVREGSEFGGPSTPPPASGSHK